VGGSGAAGDVIATVCADASPVPIGTVRGYTLPAWCQKSDAVACVSYSGNTEEPLSAYAEALRRGCPVVAISSGGELAERARRDGVTLVSVPPDCPQPRAALGYLTGAVLGMLAAAGIVERDQDVEQAHADLNMAIQELGREITGPRNRAKDIAAWIGDRIPVIWGSEGVSWPAAWRWKCGFNENAKIPAFASALPELDHHEVVGWSKGTGDGFALIVLREPGEHQSVGPRLAATLEQVEASGIGVREVRAEGRSPLARALLLMLIGDAASAYHALSRGIDPAPIEAISAVKARLGGERS
jgi:glucose/mannose-6-phosphate isomerase